jgi:hypothetical protein
MGGETPQAQAGNLEALARARFGDLKPAEIKLLAAIPRGELAICGPNADGTDPANDPAKAESWAADREIRADLIRWLCVDRVAKELVDPNGIRALGARILGSVDLSYVTVPFGLTLWGCRLTEEVRLRSTDIASLDLQGTWLHTLFADDARVKGAVFLRHGFRATGGVRLLGARMGGDLDLSDATLLNPPLAGIPRSGHAMGADGIEVTGSIFLNGNFHAEGAVRLLGAQIGGTLDCANATIHNAPESGLPNSGMALIADRAVVRGTAFLNQGFRATGQVRLAGAKVGGDLDCSSATFANPLQPGLAAAGTALIVDTIDVTGAIYLNRGFRAEGEVRLVDARIGGQLNCDGAQIQGWLNAEALTVKGLLFWRNIVAPRLAQINLRNASAGALADDAESWPEPGNLALDGFVYQRISDGPRDATLRLGWLARQSSFASQPYRQLAKLLSSEGDDAGARFVLFERERRRRQKEDSGPLARLWSRVLDWTIGFGYYPGKSLLWLLALMFAGFVLFSGGYAVGSVAPTDKDAYATFKQTGKLPPHYETFNALVYSFESSFPLVKLGQADRWQPDPDPRWQCPAAASLPPALCRTVAPAPLRWFRWVQICLGWFFATMGVIGVTGVIRKE